jgi:hypothetical protein
MRWVTEIKGAKMMGWKIKGTYIESRSPNVGHCGNKNLERIGEN